MVSASYPSLSPSLAKGLYSRVQTDGFHRKLHGRYLNTLCDVYMLPSAACDEEEKNRIKLESQLFDHWFAEVYALVDEKLKGQNKRCLDLGAAQGDWIDSTAARCQQAQFHGVDLSPPRRPPAALGSPRATFEVMDINVGLESHHRMYDVVHARNISQGIQRLTAFIQDVADCLRPGGLGVFMEWDYQIYTPEHIPFTSPTPTYDPSALTPRFGERGPLATERLPALFHLLRSIFRASTAAGSHITAASHLGVFVQRNGDFKGVNVREVWIPVVPKPDADRAEQNRAREFRSAFMTYLSSCTPLLLAQGGYTRSQLSLIEDEARIEAMGCRVPFYVRYLAVTGVKQ
ncbi:hypothetical protein M408DRAFT_63765 [Serendipita vermifera MAFF 305830]|uniref:Methyltransferase domain-containing protein n=1 Tax=Serendipita vermifera MAFF 305830 TaxID=933852 RepID=A0A0C2X182_SERVB|nr:hypothetical protein M408DRAFT_63765 [Serendipita vermifera MAFF 305830]